MKDDYLRARRLSIAPMMAWTDRHFRYLMRLITKHSLLYSEMLHHNALIQGNQSILLDFNEIEHPVICQLGGSDAKSIYKAAKIACEWGYDGLNLNCGCPSDKVQAGKFGAILMQNPALVADLVKAMQDGCGGILPISVKHRIGVAENLNDAKAQGWFSSQPADKHKQNLQDFIETLAGEGIEEFIIHARIAILAGLSPKDNRAVPPLFHDWVKAVISKMNSPNLHVSLNGGIDNLHQIHNHLKDMDGVMVGRAAYKRPFDFLLADDMIFNDNAHKNTDLSSRKREIIAKMAEYCENEMQHNTPFRLLGQAMLGLYAGETGVAGWRRTITAMMQDKSLTPLAARKQLEQEAERMLMP